MIDNYDSFTYNLVQELSEISGAEIEVRAQRRGAGRRAARPPARRRS